MHEAMALANSEPSTHGMYVAVRCKLDLTIWRGLVLRFCNRPLLGAASLPATMDIRAHPISFSDRPLKAASPSYS